MKKRLTLSVATLMIVALSGCSSMVSKGALEAEGRSAYAQMRSQVPLVRDPATVDFVTCVAESVVAALEGDATKYEWELAIFDQEVVNAFVLPGGKMAVYQGLLRVTKNDAQLAAVIGHEIAHVTEGHSAERLARTQATMTGAQVLSGIVGGTPIAAASASTALQIGAQLGLLLPFSRRQENEADREGLMFMANAGFDPRENVKLWKNMKSTKEREPEEFMSTHPSSDTRIERLIGLMPEALVAYNEAQSKGRNPSCYRPPIADLPER